ncbi:phage tail tape measure protein [Streptomyces sp. BR123]|uniref:phage tail tape measure protein n=1 Tax=Streptomyces sp. BR123 TaxID=2749828 RepID=UPI0015C4AC2A|nr:phage tail tape measure protein [Streptomyces sp. BR123]NXY93498.1 phage tail tape measure protein [Streptomyces sp. BR123]
MNVVLTGTATPYISATQQAARASQVAARQIQTSMQGAVNSSSAALQGMARAAATHGANAASSLNRTAGVTAAQMQRLGAQGAAAMNGVGAGAAQAAASISSLNRAAGLTGSQLARVGTSGAASVNRVSGSLGQLSGTMGAVNQSAALAATQVARLGSGGTTAVNSLATSLGAVSPAALRAATDVRRIGSAAAGAAAAAAPGRLASAWTAAAQAIGGGMRFAAVTVGSSMLEVANSSEQSLKAVRMASLGLVAVFGAAAVAAARFEKSMAEVRAVTGGSAAEMKRLEQAALQSAQATIYSATQAAKAEAELARAGISTADIIGGALRGSLDLAASGQLDLAESAIISAQAMNAFKMKGSDVGHIADVISAGAGKSATNVHAMGLAFRQAALLSSQTGLSLEQTVGTLSLFAQNALVGSDAGTSLKVMLQRLVPQSKEAKAAMDAIGFSAYDAQGNFIGLSALAQNMKTSFSQLTPEARNAAMATIFGADAVRSATILYEAGAEGVDRWVSAVNDSGYATRVAATMTDNLAGDLERLKGAFETALISSGSSANSILRDMAQALTSVVNWYNQLSPGVQSSVTVLAGLAGVLTFVGSGLLLMLPRIMAVRAELVALGVTAASVRGALLAVGRASVVIAVITGLAYAADRLSAAMRGAPPNVDKMTNSLLELAATGRITGEAMKAFGKDLDGFGYAVNRIAHPGVLDRIGDSLYEITHLGIGEDSDLAKAHDQIRALDSALSNMVRSGATEEALEAFNRFAQEAEKSGTSTEKFRSLLPGYTTALQEMDTQAKLNASSQKQLGDAASMTADQMADTRTEAEKLDDALKTLNGTAISAAEKEISFRSSLQSLTEAIKENGHSLDVTTEKGRAVKGAFLDAAQAAMAHAQAVAEQSGTIEAGNAVLEQDIAVLKRQMIAAGFSTAAVEELIGAYARVPVQVVTDIKAETAKAVADLQNVQGEIRKTNGKAITIDALTAQAEKNLRDLGFNVRRLPDGRVTVEIPTGPPTAAINAIQGRINSIQGRTVGVGVYLRATASDQDANGIPDLIQAARRDGGLIGYATGGAIRGYPTGGAVRGPGSGTSDSILARVSNGEYVIKASSVRRYGVAMLDQLNAGRLSTAGYTARPAGRIASSGPTGQPVQEVHKHFTINLNGAKQSGAEQLRDLQRHLEFAS